MISTLIGTFSLDPNRCLDLAVDVLDFELQQQQQSSSSSNNKNQSGMNRGGGGGGGGGPQGEVDHARLQFLERCIAPLQVTHKLPQLLGFKLRGRRRDPQSLLRCMTWLCQRNLLDPAQVFPYLPEPEDGGEASSSFSTVLDAAYTELRQHEKARIQALGRVRLTSAEGEEESSEYSGSKKAAATDGKHRLQQLLAVQWTQVFLQSKAFATIQPVLEPYWSKLAVLFPDTVGTAILDWVQEQVDGWIVGSPPWSKSTAGAAAAKAAKKSNATASAVTIETVLDVIAEPLEYTRESGCIARRPVLFTQLCRIFAALLKDGGGVSDDFVAFLRTFLVPSLSVFPPNPALSMELWEVVEQLPYRTRYSLYRSWRGSGLERAALKSDKPLWLIEGELQTGKDARYALKRLSKDTIRDMSRAVAKCCHGHPLVVFTTILNQIESYDNLVQVMVDACRFVTPLSLDVLGFCILQRLSGSAGGVNRSRLKESGVNVSQWLQSLESFTGAFYKRFPFIEFQGILCYLLNRLKDGHVMELGVLRTLLKSSGGWSFADYAPAASLSATQLAGRAGSTMLKRETMAFGVVDDINLRASNEVRRVLQSDNMGVSLLILLAQVRHQIVFESSGRPKPVKLIGNLVDTCQVIMAILLDFLTNAADGHTGQDGQSAAEIRKYAGSLPSLSELYDSYKVDVASTWMLCRPLIRAASTDGLFDDDMDIEDGLTKFKTTEESRKGYKNMLPDEAWSHLSVDLFEFFFTNTLYDLFCPEDVYVGEIARLDKETERLSQKKNAHQPPHNTVQPGAVPETTDQEELERAKKVASSLSTDYVKQKSHVKSIHAEMASKASEFFVSDEVSQRAAVTFFVRCIYPRCMQGPDDAMYCAHFVSHLHQNETPGFSTLHFFDTLIVTLSRSLYCLTEGEAACVSILLLETWKTVSRWRYNDGAFEAEVVGKPGSFMVVPSHEDGGETAVATSQEAYQKLYNKWHAAIGASCIGCLQSKEYMHLRNCLVVLTRMLEVYPTRPKLANQLIKALAPLQEETNTLADIRASAQAYSMQLLKARDDGVWKEEDAATVKARHEKEEAAAAARQKKAEEQMAEIERDSEKITEQIGEWDSRDRSRGRAGGHPPGDHGASRGDRYDHADHRGGDTRRRVPPGAVEDRRNLATRPPPPASREPNQPRHPPPQSDRWQRDRAPTSSYASIDPSARGGGGRQEEPPSQQSGPGRNLEGRWQRPSEQSAGGGGGGNRKRSRTSSPVEQGESREEQPSSAKRSRRDEESRGGGRRRGRR